MKGHELENAFLKTYDEIRDSVFRRCFFKTSQVSVAEDLTQEAFVRVWDYIKANPDTEIENLKAFIFTAANNLIKDYYKKSKSKPFSSLTSFDISLVEDTGSDTVMYAEVEQILGVMDELSEEDKTLLVLRFVEEWDVKDIAEELGLRANTVAVRIYRAKERLQDIFDSKQKQNDEE